MPSAWDGLVNPGEFIQGAGHAEETIINSLGPDEEIGYGGASRNFCLDTCYRQLNVRGMRFGGEGYFGGLPDKSPYSLVWNEGF